MNQDDLEKSISSLSGWTVKGNALHRVFMFKDFLTSFGFMTMVAIEAERMDHHPDWRNVWNRVEITLFTHDKGAITEKDVQLARIIDDIAKRWGN